MTRGLCCGKLRFEITESPPVQSSACLLTGKEEKCPGWCSPSGQSKKRNEDDCQPLDGTTVRYTRRSNYGNQRAHTPFVNETDERSPLKADMASHSVYREDFQAWDSPPKVRPYRPCDNLKVNREMFAGTTTSKDSFWQTSSPTRVQESFKPPPPAREVPPFDGTTNYRSHYLLHPVQPRRPRERPTYQPNGAPLTRVYTSHQDFRGQPSEMAKSFKPKVAWEKNPAAFQGTTEFADKFLTWPPQPRFQPKTEVHRSPAGDMALLSTTRADFREHRGFQRTKSARPARETWARDPRPTEASVMRSTMKEDYKAWATTPRTPVARQPQEMERPTGPFAQMTTARESYTPKVAQRSLSCKPPARPLITGPLMERDSVYRASYTARSTPRRCPVQDGGGGATPGFRYNSVEPRRRWAGPGRGADGEPSCFRYGGGPRLVGVGAKIGT